MITLAELNPKKYATDGIQRSNLLVLCQRLNIVRAAWGKPMRITSGLRDAAQQANLIKAGLSKATKSKHLVGMAADVADLDGALGAWCWENVGVLEKAGLWCEDPQYTPGWVHFQSASPSSGRRFFKP
jgi:hypothetical protein